MSTLAEKRGARLPIGSNIIDLSSPDRVTLKGVKSFAVSETERGNPETSIALTGRGMENRQPVNEHKKELRLWHEWKWDVYPNQPGKKWCSQCGKWKALGEFTKKSDTRDGRHPYCNECRNAQKRMHYWLMKEARELDIVA